MFINAQTIASDKKTFTIISIVLLVIAFIILIPGLVELHYYKKKKK